MKLSASVSIHYDIRVTPAAHAAAGFKYDSTLGFNDNIGFRFGTCHPWHLYDLKAEKVGGVLTLLWHPNWIIIPHWWNLYLRTLEYLQHKNAWFCSVKEVGEWWKHSIREVGKLRKWGSKI